MNTHKSLLSLSINDDSYPPQKIICRGKYKDYNWKDFCAGRAAWQQSFQKTDATAVALYNPDTFDFACALSALWRCGKTPILPGNNSPQTIQQLKQFTQYFAGDFGNNLKGNFGGDVNRQAGDKKPSSTVDTERNYSAILLSPSATSTSDTSTSTSTSNTTGSNNNTDTSNPTTQPQQLNPNPNPKALIIFTSGSTGQPLPIEKTFRQLDSEIDTLENLWGQHIDHATVTGTVSHQHIYGLLFRLLWPLTCGREFVDCARNYSEEIFLDAQKFQSIITIMTPAHLAHLPVAFNNKPCDASSDTLRYTKANHTDNPVRAVFSSAAPLSLNAAQDTLDKFQQNAIEIYGSSETGGIAYRQQLKNCYWKPLPNVEIKVHTEIKAHTEIKVHTEIEAHTDNNTPLLCIKSPHLPNQKWFISADRCDKINSQGFMLGARTDRIAKIGGKRISLSAIEQQLQRHDWVDEVRVITLAERNNRTAALVVLNNKGNDQLIQHGQRFIHQQLAAQLKYKIERIAIPRYWRYWDSIPRNPQGKINHSDITALFSRQPKPTEATLISHSLHHNELNSQAELNLTIPHNLSWFDGHFPGRPILPGVVQTHWAHHYGHKFFPIHTAFSHLEVIKFQQVIRPGESIQLSLQWIPTSSKLTFTYSSNQKKLSSGRVVFEKTNTLEADRL